MKYTHDQILDKISYMKKRSDYWKDVGDKTVLILMLEQVIEENKVMKNLLTSLEPAIARSIADTWKPEDFEEYRRLTSCRSETITDDALILWAHLTSEHGGVYEGFNEDDLIIEHKHEHDGPGTIRNHAKSYLGWDIKKIREVLTN